jgi:hypothetical protein
MMQQPGGVGGFALPVGPKTAPITARVPVSTSVINSIWGQPPCGHRPSQPRLRSLSGVLIELQPSKETVR